MLKALKAVSRGSVECLDLLVMHCVAEADVSCMHVPAGPQVTTRSRAFEDRMLITSAIALDLSVTPAGRGACSCCAFEAFL